MGERLGPLALRRLGAVALGAVALRQLRAVALRRRAVALRRLRWQADERRFHSIVPAELWSEEDENYQRLSRRQQRNLRTGRLSHVDALVIQETLHPGSLSLNRRIDPVPRLAPRQAGSCRPVRRPRARRARRTRSAVCVRGDPSEPDLAAAAASRSVAQ
jgi:hypothetical protein